LYRTDVDDGYERYSYISLHVELLSNHLLYKTPAPSPTADRERKLLYNARKERATAQQRFKQLQRRVATLESKCAALQQRPRLASDVGDDVSGDAIKEEGSSNSAKTLIHLMADLSTRHKGKSLRSGKKIYEAPKISEKELGRKFVDFRRDFNTMVVASTADEEKMAEARLVARTTLDSVKRVLETRTGLRVTRTLLSGSLGTNTCCVSRCDADLHLFSPDVPRVAHVTWLPSLLVALRHVIEDATSDGQLNDVTHLTTRYKHFGVDDVIVSRFPSQFARNPVSRF